MKWLYIRLLRESAMTEYLNYLLRWPIVREVYIKDQTNGFDSSVYAAILAENGKHLHTIIMDKYDQEYRDRKC